ncbi:MAG: DUF998 domain-containing protein [Candidatus Thorarchaeota archaeon]|nr:MAG: DUF998 domain-containing protein [Candidatus Thorarchaeota archaeon]
MNCMRLVEEIRTFVNEKHFPQWGIIGSIIGLVLILTPQLFYTGTMGESFSMFNHYVSELGELGVSEFAMMFNIGLMLAGILFIPFMIGLGLYLDNFIGKIAAVVGAFSALSIYLVGIYPMNNVVMHGITAISFFLSGLVMTVLWALAILVQKKVRIPKILSLGGFINAAIFALFLYGSGEGFGAIRPEFSLRVTLEWAIYFAIVSYMFILALYVWRKERNGVSLHLDAQSFQEQ